MSKSKKNRIDTTPTPSGLNNSFAALNLQGLPSGPDQPLRASPRPNAPAKLGRVVLRRETARRGGKTVVVISEFATHLSFSFIEDLARRLRKALGCGGSAQGRVVEIQGDQPDRIRSWLETEGFRVVGLQSTKRGG